MKIKISFLILLSLLITGNAFADIILTLPKDCEGKTLSYSYAPIKQYAEAKTRAETGMVYNEPLKINDTKVVLPIPNEAKSYLYNLKVDDNSIQLFVLPGENIDVDVKSCNPFYYTMKGSALIDGMNDLQLYQAPFFDKVRKINAGEIQMPEDGQLDTEYNDMMKNFISENPDNPAVPLALMDLEDEDLIKTYNAIQDNLKDSILYPLVENSYQRALKNIEMKKKQEALQSGDTPAPNFTLKDLEGKDVSLSDFKGKWVILDFWGSWCPWCIKGFPELKEAYKEYEGKLEIIGIDCKESEAEWKAGVAKYELPWINVYNPEGTSLLSEYGVQGFPTKAIIDPEGKIRNITVGHDPAFFVVLNQLLGNNE